MDFQGHCLGQCLALSRAGPCWLSVLIFLLGGCFPGVGSVRGSWSEPGPVAGERGGRVRKLKEPESGSHPQGGHRPSPRKAGGGVTQAGTPARKYSK